MLFGWFSCFPYSLTQKVENGEQETWERSPPTPNAGPSKNLKITGRGRKERNHAAQIRNRSEQNNVWFLTIEKRFALMRDTIILGYGVIQLFF